MLKKILLSLLGLTLLFSGTLSYTFATWTQEDALISGRTSLENKISLLKITTVNGVLNADKIELNKNELESLWNQGQIGSFLKTDFFEALGNNLMYVNINGTLKQTFFSYKLVDDIKVISLDTDFLIQNQKNPDESYKDATIDDVQAKLIAVQIQLYLTKLVGVDTAKAGMIAKTYVRNNYSVVTVSNRVPTSINKVFDQLCNGMTSKTLCFEGTNKELVVFGLKSTITASASNQQEYEELVSKYTIDGKVQLPGNLQTELAGKCPLTATKTVSRFVENNKLDDCGLIPHDFDCDGTNEWIDYNPIGDITTIYGINTIGSGSSAMINIKVILYLNGKKIVKFYSNDTGCYSNILTTDSNELNAYKIIEQGFDGVTGDLVNFNIQPTIENGITVPSNKLQTVVKGVDGFNSVSTPQVYTTNITDNYKIDLEVIDTQALKLNLGSLISSTTNNIANKVLQFGVNQQDLGIKDNLGTKLEVPSANNRVTNKTITHYDFTFKNNLFTAQYNGAPMYSYNTNDGSVTAYGHKVAFNGANNLTQPNFLLTPYFLFTDHYQAGATQGKTYSDFSISKPDSSKLYLYKLDSDSSGVKNFYLSQVIDTTGYTYNLFGKGLAADATCQAVAFKNSVSFDNNQSTAVDFIGQNSANGCDFRSFSISSYTDPNGKLNYLKKTKINGVYNKTLGLFEFLFSQDSTLVGVDFGDILNPVLKNCLMSQIVNNELDACSDLTSLDIDGDGRNEWVLSKLGEIEVYNNIIESNTLGELTPRLELIYKSAGDSYCTTINQSIDYFKRRSGGAPVNTLCKKSADIDSDIALYGGVKVDCTRDSTMVFSSTDNYQFVYSVTGLDANTKKYTRTQILPGANISCN